MPSPFIAYLLIGIVCGIASTALVFKDFSSMKVFALPALGGIIGAFVGGTTVGAATWKETLLGIAHLFSELAKTSGSLLLGGILIFPTFICGLLFSFTAALVVHTFFLPQK